jgi:hypothetical protein
MPNISCLKSPIKLPNLSNVTDWLALLLHIQEVLDSILDPQNGYPDLRFCGFTHSLKENAWILP